jgi:hypothetical protein
VAGSVRSLCGSLAHDRQSGRSSARSLGMCIGQLGIVIDQLAGSDQVGGHNLSQLLRQPTKFGSYASVQGMCIDAFGHRRFVWLPGKPWPRLIVGPLGRSRTLVLSAALRHCLILAVTRPGRKAAKRKDQSPGTMVGRRHSSRSADGARSSGSSSALTRRLCAPLDR